MKWLYYLLLFSTVSNAQLPVAWEKQFTDYTEEGLTGIVPSNNNVYVATHKGVRLYSDKGVELNMAPAKSGIYFMQWHGLRLYTNGATHFSERNLMGDVLTEYSLYLGTDTLLGANTGAILDGYFYTLSMHDWFLRFDLQGNRIFRKRIGQLSSNLTLAAGGSHLYVSANLHQPAEGMQLLRYDKLGNQLWSVPHNGLVFAADDQGNCFTFIQAPNAGSTISMVNAAGILQWTENVPDLVVMNGSVSGNELIVCGVVPPKPGSKSGPAFSILSAADGSITSQPHVQVYENPLITGGNFRQVAADEHAVYLGGSQNNPKMFFFVKLDKPGSMTAADNNQSGASFGIFPNPGRGKFTVECNSPGTGTSKISVQNSMGQTVFETTSPEPLYHELDLSNQSPGVYCVGIESSHSRTFKKLIVE